MAVTERWPDYSVQFQQISTLWSIIEVDLVIQVCDMARLDRYHCIPKLLALLSHTMYSMFGVLLLL